MKKLISNIVLFLASILLAVIFVPISLLYVCIELFSCPKKVWKILPNLFFAGAKSIDQFGNAFCFLFLNAILIVSDQMHPFGNEDETISSVIGRNKQIDNLTKAGKFLDKILNKIDSNHSIDAIGE